MHEYGHDGGTAGPPLPRRIVERRLRDQETRMNVLEDKLGERRLRRSPCGRMGKMNYRRFT